MPEPKILRRGKRFHRAIQRTWLEKAEGVVVVEKAVKKKSGARGRIDVFVDSESGNNMVAIAEIKDSNWDRMTPTALRRNIARQIRQVWSYVHSHIEAGKDVSPGIIFRKRPKLDHRLELIERTFNENGIQVVWEDETIEERRARSH